MAFAQVSWHDLHWTSYGQATLQPLVCWSCVLLV